MSSAESLDKLSRDELVERVTNLEEKVEQLEENTVSRTTLNVLLSELGEVEDFTADPVQQRSLLTELVETLASIERRLETIEGDVAAIRDLGSQTTSKEEKIAQIVEYASNKQSVDQDRVTVLPKTIKGITDVSQRYAYDSVNIVSVRSFHSEIVAVDRRSSRRDFRRGIARRPRQCGREEADTTTFTGNCAQKRCDAD